MVRWYMIFTLPETNIAGWKIHHFDGMKPRKDGIFMGYVSFREGIVFYKLCISYIYIYICICMGVEPKIGVVKPPNHPL